MEQQTWWAQTLVATGGGWSPDVYGLHSVQAQTEEEAVETLARKQERPKTRARRCCPESSVTRGRAATTTMPSSNS